MSTKQNAGNSLPVQWLEPCVLTADGPGSGTSGWRTQPTSHVATHTHTQTQQDQCCFHSRYSQMGNWLIWQRFTGEANYISE